MEMFAHVNYCGFTKITKKHDRMTGRKRSEGMRSRVCNAEEVHATEGECDEFLQLYTVRQWWEIEHRLRNSVRIVEDQYIVLSKCLSHIKTIPPIAKSREVKEVNDSLIEIDKKADEGL